MMYQILSIGALSNPVLWAWILGGVLLFCLIMWPVSYLVASNCVYNATLRRRSKDKWGRRPSGNETHTLKMDEEGMAWQAKNAERKTDVHIVNSGMNLYGEYYDFGSDQCVIILSGRTESLRYGYYFAQPYAAAGWNVLVIDPRAHGLSDGEFNTVGFEESKDALAWTAYLHDTFHIRSVIYHGICIGAAAGMLAITSEDCPDYVDGIVTDGMFANFGESMKNHLIERKKPIFLLYDMINMHMKRHTGYSMDYGPINVIERLHKPLLMLHGTGDLYSVPDYAQKLYELAATEHKELVWFENGKHSMLRYTDPQKYDKAIQKFLANCFVAIS